MRVRRLSRPADGASSPHRAQAHHPRRPRRPRVARVDAPVRRGVRSGARVRRGTLRIRRRRRLRRVDRRGPRRRRAQSARRRATRHPGDDDDDDNDGGGPPRRCRVIVHVSRSSRRRRRRAHRAAHSRRSVRVRRRRLGFVRRRLRRGGRFFRPRETVIRPERDARGGGARRGRRGAQLARGPRASPLRRLVGQRRRLRGEQVREAVGGERRDVRRARVRLEPARAVFFRERRREDAQPGGGLSVGSVGGVGAREGVPRRIRVSVSSQPGRPRGDLPPHPAGHGARDEGGAAPHAIRRPALPRVQGVLVLPHQPFAAPRAREGCAERDGAAGAAVPVADSPGRVRGPVPADPRRLVRRQLRDERMRLPVHVLHPRPGVGAPLVPVLAARRGGGKVGEERENIISLGDDAECVVGGVFLARRLRRRRRRRRDQRWGLPASLRVHVEPPRR
mmetsp:Transcript_14799/g.60484  ORF Transcript_14799/g.60484 Transcript_14799/m.60484 type:complete len:449 (+) Transcript_14799:997-2343(+)